MKTFGQFTDEWRRRQVVEEPPQKPVIMRGLFGPWLPEIPEPDRVAGLRALAALVAVYCGSSHPAVMALRKAESDREAAPAALRAFDGLPALKQRHVIGTYAKIMRPEGPS